MIFSNPDSLSGKLRIGRLQHRGMPQIVGEVPWNFTVQQTGHPRMYALTFCSLSECNFHMVCSAWDSDMMFYSCVALYL